MLAIREPIGRFVAIANLEKNIFTQKSIEQDIDDLVDLLTIRLKNRPIPEVADSLLENIFDLRLEMFEWLVDNNKDLNSYLELINGHIAVNMQLAPFSDIAETISKVLLAYEKIASPMLSSIGSESIEVAVEDLQHNKPKYDSLRHFSLHPSPQIRSVKTWLDSSLRLEVGLIVADLILTGQIKFPKERIKPELIEFLYDSINKFGAYSIFTGFWKPDIADTSNLTNNMKILAAAFEMDNNNFHTTSKEGLFELVNN